jgi:hemoglobin/transferrin/lactoferrin receptor protein
MKKAGFLLLFITIAHFSFSQDTTRIDSSSSKELDEIIISFNRWEQKQNEVPNLIKKISRVEIFRNTPQTAADMLSQTGAVFVQKSQLGGGSPMIRGFATNRVLLVVDGVRMNNAIYRSGNLQNVISIDPLALETAEVVFGPGSLIYGSDAIGGVMDFHTLQPRLTETGKIRIKGSASARYSSANNENTFHTDLNFGWKKISLLSSVTYSKFDDLKMGKQGGQNNYLRTEYVQRINNVDSIVKNSNPRVQRFSGYDQINYLGKFRFKPRKYLDMQYSFTYAATGEAPRYDRLIQYRNNQLRFAEWSYGPMIWNMHNFQLLYNKKTSLFDDLRITSAIQNYKESRIDRTRNNNNRNTQTETVDAFSFNTDLEKSMGKGKIFYGLEYVYNKVGSTGSITNITNNNQTPAVSRYPDGSTWSTAAIYGSYKLNFREQFTFTGGLRYSINSLRATFDTLFIKFPYQSIDINPGALTGNAGLVYRPNISWQLNANISTGFRMPNVDDAGKLFESAPGNITVPNPLLDPEYAWNFEIGFVKSIEDKLRIETAVFHSILDNALVRRPDTFRGADSILFDGVMSRVESLQNAANATVFGFQLSIDAAISKYLKFITHANWITGKETDETGNEQVPLRHAPPFYGSSMLRFKKEKFFGEISGIYNSTITNAKLAPVEQAKTDIYAKDGNGKPYSPGWVVLNLRTAYDVNKNINLAISWENITNRRYRPYSSGIVAAGSNLIVSLRWHF